MKYNCSIQEINSESIENLIQAICTEDGIGSTAKKRVLYRLLLNKEKALDLICDSSVSHSSFKPL